MRPVSLNKKARLLLQWCILVSFIFPANAVLLAQESEANYIVVSKEFIQKVKRQQRSAIANEMMFPMRRRYPLPDVKSVAEFLDRFDEIFDDSLTRMIVQSDPVEDWSQVGWRGVMLNRGILWLDDDGSVIAVNYESEEEHRRRLRLVEEERQKLYPSLRDFKTPKPAFQTKTYTIRIDEMDESKYRMCLWLKDTPMSEKPVLVIADGDWIPEGSGGNNRFEFRYKDLVYTCSEIILGRDDDPPAEFMIMKGEKEILREDAVILRH
jgi:hypothetical protein